MRRHRAVPRSWLEIRFAHKLLAPSGRCRVWLGEHQGEVVAGAMCLAAGSSFEMVYAGSDPGANDLRPMHAVYWHAIESVIATSKTVVDWGTAPADSSLGNFKRQWGAEPVPCFHYSYAPRAHPAAPPSETLAADTARRRALGPRPYRRARDRGNDCPPTSVVRNNSRKPHTGDRR